MNSLKAKLAEAGEVQNTYEETLACVDQLRHQAADRLKDAQREAAAARRAADEQMALNRALQERVGAPVAFRIAWTPKTYHFSMA